METKLLEERIDALNANIEKIIIMVGKQYELLHEQTDELIALRKEEIVEQARNNKERLEEIIRHNKARESHDEAHDKAMENYKPYTEEEHIEMMKKAAIEVRKAMDSEDEWWKGEE